MIYNFETTYTQLDSKLFQIVSRPHIPDPRIVLLNESLIQKLGIGYSQDRNPELLLGPSQEQPFAQAYAGHQFGYFTVLGDGRAMILGEHLSPENDRFDIQLKGSGRTQYSRGGDGLATISSMIREYLFSFAMKNLGIKTSESLAVLSTDQQVVREELHEGAILIRVMQSHIRIGTFEYVSRFCGRDVLKDFADYTIERHYPRLAGTDQKYLKFFRSVMMNTVDMVVNWYRVGFIHGVMNTDNISITGETFDYGPCAFMNRYDLSTTFSRIDRHKRYSFGNQKMILKWNLGVLGAALLPLFDDDPSQTVLKYKEEMDRFDSVFDQKFMAMMKKKLGIDTSKSADKQINAFLLFLETNRADYTNTFIELMYPHSVDENIYQTSEFRKMRSELGKVGLDPELMGQNNPHTILRNHLVEEAIDDYRETKRLNKVQALLDAVESPYAVPETMSRFQQPPTREFDSSYRTHCNT